MGSLGFFLSVQAEINTRQIKKMNTELWEEVLRIRLGISLAANVGRKAEIQYGFNGFLIRIKVIVFSLGGKPTLKMSNTIVTNSEAHD